MTWLNNWTFRKKITVNGSSAGAVTNYQLKITINAGAGTDSSTNIFLNNKGSFTDFRDVRFTQSDGSTLLNHWFETGSLSSGVSVVVWIQINSIPASPSTNTIYIYYGNTSATDASNGKNTFPILFDDFPGSSIDTGVWAGDTAATSVSGSILTITNPGAGLWKTVHSIATTTIPHAFRGRINWFTTSANRRMDFGGQNSTGSDYLIFDETITPALAIRATTGGVGTLTGSSWTTGSYHNYEVKWRTNEARYTQDDSEVSASPLTTNVPSVASLWITMDIWSNSGSQTYLIDWALIREYESPEPTFGIIGVEEVAVSIEWYKA